MGGTRVSRPKVEQMDFIGFDVAFRASQLPRHGIYFHVYAIPLRQAVNRFVGGTSTTRTVIENMPPEELVQFGSQDACSRKFIPRHSSTPTFRTQARVRKASLLAIFCHHADVLERCGRRYIRSTSDRRRWLRPDVPHRIALPMASARAGSVDPYRTGRPPLNNSDP
jgi:hypothetical protein